VATLQGLWKTVFHAVQVLCVLWKQERVGGEIMDYNTRYEVERLIAEKIRPLKQPRSFYDEHESDCIEIWGAIEKLQGEVAELRKRMETLEFKFNELISYLQKTDWAKERIDLQLLKVKET
jgi:hypothetical protein